MSSSSEMNQYWYSNVDIHRKVITQDLQYYLGPQATVRPYTFEVRDSKKCDRYYLTADPSSFRAKTGSSSPPPDHLFQM